MAKKQYFGEETKSKRKTAARKPSGRGGRKATGRRGGKRKYTRRAPTATGGLVQITVPASLAYQIGTLVGQANA